MSWNDGERMQAQADTEPKTDEPVPTLEQSFSDVMATLTRAMTKIPDRFGRSCLLIMFDDEEVEGGHLIHSRFAAVGKAVTPANVVGVLTDALETAEMATTKPRKRKAKQ